MSSFGTHYPLGFNAHVASMSYASDVNMNDGLCTFAIPAMAALDADGILDGSSIASVLTVTAFETTYSADNMGKFGRNVTVVSDGAATSLVTVTGTDYLGQVQVEAFTLNGTTPVVGVKCFKNITSVVNAVTASRTIDVGWGNSLGVPYKTEALIVETVDGVVPGSAGAMSVGTPTDPATATTAAPIGRYVPHSSQVPDGSKAYELTVKCDQNNLYGVATFGG